MKSLYILLALVLCSLHSYSQTYVDGYFEWENDLNPSLGVELEPLSTDDVDEIQYQGEYLDFSGGYQVGDVVADFTLWSGDNESFTLSDLLEESASEGKYTILFSGSNSCIRFTNFFNGENTTYAAERQFIYDHIDDFNWALIYGHEAHPIDIEFCASNCPLVVLAGPSGVGEFQHPTYGSRLESLERWTSIQDGSQAIPDSILTYTPGIEDPTGWEAQDYSPGFPDIPSWPDNPDNSVYDTFFMRPFGLIVLDCAGEVVARAEWMNQWLLQGEHGEELGTTVLSQLLAEGGSPCSEWVELCDEDSLDSDNDSYCDDWETYNGTGLEDVCSPDDTDNDEDGLCNNEEELLGTDPDLEDTDGDGVSDSEELDNGTDPLVDDTIIDNIEELNAAISIYPNPSNGVITLEYTSSEVLKARAYGLDGKLVHEQIISPSEHVLSLQHLTMGTYLLEFTSENGGVLRKRVLIK